MSLPNPSMSFSPFAILTAAEMNDLVENIEALAAGTGLDNGAVPATKLGTGAIIQEVSTDFSSVATGTTTIPVDDTIPQISEGVEFMTQAITPRSISSTLIIEVEMMLAISSNGQRVCALFQDATANAIAAKSTYVGNFSDPVVLVMRKKVTAGTTSPITFSVRAGSETAGTWTFNGSATARRFGAIAKSSIKITEIAP